MTLSCTPRNMKTSATVPQRYIHLRILRMRILGRLAMRQASAHPATTYVIRPDVYMRWARRARLAGQYR